MHVFALLRQNANLFRVENIGGSVEPSSSMKLFVFINHLSQSVSIFLFPNESLESSITVSRWDSPFYGTESSRFASNFQSEALLFGPLDI